MPLSGSKTSSTALHSVNTRQMSEKEKAELQEACKEFESFFLYYLLKNMDKTVLRSENSLDGGRPAQFYREMLYEKIAASSASKGMGLSDKINAQMQQFLINRTYK